MLKKIRKCFKRCFISILILGLLGYYFYFCSTDHAFERRGRLYNRQISEASGLVKSRINPNVIWLHNDSGHNSRIYAFSTKGNYLRTYEIDGLKMIDFEDISRIDFEGESFLLLCDLGGNTKLGSESPAQIILIKEPSITDCQSQEIEKITDYVTLDLTYEHTDLKPNIEAAAYNSKAQSIYLFSKTLFTESKSASVYSVNISQILNSIREGDKGGEKIDSFDLKENVLHLSESNQTTDEGSQQLDSQVIEEETQENKRSMMSDNLRDYQLNQYLDDVYKLKAKWITDIDFKDQQDLNWVDFRHLILLIFDYPSAVTGADFSDDGQQLLIRTYGCAFYYTFDLEQAYLKDQDEIQEIINNDLIYKQAQMVRTPFEAIGEAIAFDGTADGFYTVSEGHFQNLYHVNLNDALINN